MNDIDKVCRHILLTFSHINSQITGTLFEKSNFLKKCQEENVMFGFYSAIAYSDLVDRKHKKLYPFLSDVE